jgi:hypothetical protein
MRVRILLPAAAVALAGCLAGLQAADAAPSAPSVASVAPHTVTVVVRPVTSSGHAASGFVVKNEPTGSVDCSFAEESPGAVSDNILLCSPSAEYAVACWKAAAAKHALCMRDPHSHKLARIPRTGKFASAKVLHKDRGPLRMVLGNGAVCSIRDGGAWGQLQSHRKWVGTYSCTKGGDVWAPAKAKHQGVNETNPVWTVHTASASGTGAVSVRTVTKAWFVGTAG